MIAPDRPPSVQESVIEGRREADRDLESAMNIRHDIRPLRIAVSIEFVVQMHRDVASNRFLVYFPPSLISSSSDGRDHLLLNRYVFNCTLICFALSHSASTRGDDLNKLIV